MFLVLVNYNDPKLESFCHGHRTVMSLTLVLGGMTHQDVFIEFSSMGQSVRSHSDSITAGQTVHSQRQVINGSVYTALKTLERERLNETQGAFTLDSNTWSKPEFDGLFTLHNLGPNHSVCASNQQLFTPVA